VEGGAEGAGGKWNSILGGEQGGASRGPDWLTMEGLMGGGLEVPSAVTVTRGETRLEREAGGQCSQL